jgi:hypothetical protein
MCDDGLIAHQQHAYAPARARRRGAGDAAARTGRRECHARRYFSTSMAPTPLLDLSLRALLLLLLCINSLSSAHAIRTTALETTTRRGDPVDGQIDAVHAKSMALRRQLLGAWTFEADATPTVGHTPTYL